MGLAGPTPSVFSPRRGHRPRLRQTGTVSEATQRLLKAWRGEIEARYVYEILARREKDPRRAEILRLVAQGLSDAMVAEQLVISRRTVNWHLTSIYSKIGVTSRSAATRYSIEQNLI